MQATSSGRRFGLWLAVTLCASMAMGASCRHRNGSSPRVDAASARDTTHPSLRIYYIVDLDGYLEPCGCQQHPLGGIDRMAQYIARERPNAPRSVVVAAGNTFFEYPTLDARMAYQERAKAESLTHILDGLELAAYAPGPSDFAMGAEGWRALSSATHAPALASNAGLGGPVIRDVSGVRVGIVGVSDFRPSEGEVPAGAPSATDAVEAARTAVAQARAQGARVVVVLASVPRRVARAIGAVEGVDFVVAAREESLTPPAPERVGNAFLVTATNQGKGLGMIDLFLDGTSAFRDASESSRAAERQRLTTNIDTLRGRLAQWASDPSADPTAVATQRARLTELERSRATLDANALPTQGNFFRARVVQIDDQLPKLPAVEQRIATYFREVNEHNRVEYASLRAPEAPAGTAHYIGNVECQDCHQEAYDVWARTPHAHAYHTLEVVSKNFNLSCVGCHVTGYRQPGGSEVVQNEGLRDVGCESCHGPGSLHALARGHDQRVATIRRTVNGDFCARECHTHEHSDQFNFERYLPHILGPGHGRPIGDTTDAGPLFPDASH